MTVDAMRDDPLRPPAVPLIACDPYFSIWSRADKLTDTFTSHWTGKRQSLTSLIRVDGSAFRLMGDAPADLPALPQTSVVVLPTRTICEFRGHGVALTLTFLTPVLPDDIAILSRPVTYLRWGVESTDGDAHDVSAYFSASGELAVNTPDQEVCWDRVDSDTLDILRIGSTEQPVLEKDGDDLRIDWGYAYVAASKGQGAAYAGSFAEATASFRVGGGLPAVDDTGGPRAAEDDLPVLAFAFDLGGVKEPTSRRITVAYDDGYSIVYMGQQLRPYWRRDGMDALGLLETSKREYDALADRCARFDEELVDDLTRAGGAKYARLCSLAYRQAQAANKVTADADGSPLMFSKENFSNGCIGTVDVMYPMIPQYLLLCPTLAKASVEPVLAYAASERWKFPFAPHDLGRYPHANGQVYGGGEDTADRQMPVEESGNMILLVASIVQAEGSAAFADRYWPQLTEWAEYLADKGFDPEHQLCTDDFAGHLAHNVNLSVKAIMALGAYAQLCDARGETEAGGRYRALAEEFAARWVREADDGDHYRLTFDGAGTWSQKYNLVWNRVLDLRLFPDSVAATEMAHYRTVQSRYGLPLDSRQGYTKIDWILWTATLTGDRGDFDTLVAPAYDFANETTDRVPLTDWYETETATLRNMIARPVVGGFFMQMLTEGELWRKWADRDTTGVADWAAIPN
ncbi:MAG: DUF4965 domain-containing protein [Candidatus Poribacteria bacterium]